MNFTKEEIIEIQNLLSQKDILTDEELKVIKDKPISEVRRVVTRYKNLLVNSHVSIEDILAKINEKKTQEDIIPPPIDITQNLDLTIHSIMPLTPPKFRPKSRFGGMAVESVGTLPPVMIEMEREETERQLQSIPRLPKWATSHNQNATPINTGSLSVLCYPSQQSRVCRVLGHMKQSDIDYSLVACIDGDHSSWYVPNEYLMILEKNKIHTGLDEDEEMQRCSDNNELTVDWLLERTFSQAKTLVMSCTEVLIPTDQEVPPDKQLVEKAVFQSVTFAALLYVCRVASRWTIPSTKIRDLIRTMLKTNPAKYVTTKSYLSRIEQLLTTLLLPEQKS